MDTATTFCKIELRTTDADAARAFYAKVLGHQRATIWPLHEQALARGAKPHWLGQLGVTDATRTAAAFVERGAMQFNPVRRDANGSEFSVLRDPGGALIGVMSPRPTERPPGIEAAWHVLNTNDVTRAIANYCDLFGWQITERVPAGAHGTMHHFAWEPDGVSVGAIADIAGRPGVHPHWIFFFDVDALEPAIATIRSFGGIALEPFILASGHRACVCDDAQGAAFGMRERTATPA